MPSIDSNVLDTILRHLSELGHGKSSLSEEYIGEQSPETLRMILARILMLHDDLNAKQEQQELNERTTPSDALKSAQEKYHDLYQNSAEMRVSVWAKNATISDCNDTLLRKTGFLRAEVIGRPILRLYHPAYQVAAAEAFKKILAHGHVSNVELAILTKSGGKIAVSLNSTAIRDENGAIIETRSTLTDITELKARQARDEELDVLRAVAAMESQQK